MAPPFPNYATLGLSFLLDKTRLRIKTVKCLALCCSSNGSHWCLVEFAAQNFFSLSLFFSFYILPFGLCLSEAVNYRLSLPLLLKYREGNLSVTF